MNNSHTTLTCGHLFNGIGGFQLAAAWAGWENVWHCEINEYCNKVVESKFPNSKCYEDIRKTDWAQVQAVDVITGGFPCQPYSSAGQRRGKEDERHLWPEMLEVISIIEPRWVVAENVYGIVSWAEGLVFEEVQTDLEDEGYEVQAYVLPAAAVNAPHRRDRVWFVAHSKGVPCHSRDKGRSRQTALPKERFNGISRWGGWPATSAVHRGDDGIPNRVDRIEALGNSIVPQLAYMIFKTINQYEREYGNYEKVKERNNVCNTSG